MSKVAQYFWSYLAYLTVVISSCLLGATTHNFIFFGWSLLIFISILSIVAADRFRRTPNPKTMREKMSGEILIMAIFSFGYLAQATHNNIFWWLCVATGILPFLFFVGLGLVTRRQGKAREEGQQASR